MDTMQPSMHACMYDCGSACTHGNLYQKFKDRTKLFQASYKLQREREREFETLFKLEMHQKQAGLLLLQNQFLLHDQNLFLPYNKPHEI